MLATFSGRNAAQEETELFQLLQFMRERSLKRYLEIGARHGDTFHEVMLSLRKKGFGLAVDMPDGLWGQKRSEAQLSSAIDDLRVRHGFNVQVLIGDSQSDITISAVRKFAPFDLALIDGDHRYGPVFKDFTNYSPMCKYVAFHDIVGYAEGTTVKGQRTLVEVPKLWKELKPHYKHWEFVARNSRMGIGVLQLREEHAEQSLGESI